MGGRIGAGHGKIMGLDKQRELEHQRHGGGARHSELWVNGAVQL